MTLYVMMCRCGHDGERHEDEQPYECMECDCRGFHNRSDLLEIAREVKPKKQQSTEAGA